MTALPVTFQSGYRLVRGEDLNADFGSLAQGFNLGAGVSYYVDETNGVDQGNGGQNPSTPLKTIGQALTLESAALTQLGLTATGRESVVYIVGSIHLTATLNWNLNGTHLVGITSPSNNCRARIAPLTVANGLTQTQITAMHPMVNVTGAGCIFMNFAAFYGFDGALTPPAASVCWLENGGRNAYNNVQLLGVGDALMAALAGARSLQIKGIGENKFVNCTIGGDTEQRITNLNATIELTNGTTRNIIRNSVIQSWNGLSTNLQILVQAGGMDRYLILDNVTMHNFGTAMAVAITNTAGGGPNGNIILTPTCVSVGATVICTSGTNYVSGPVPTANTSNLGILGT